METYKQYTWWLKALSGADEVQARRFAGAIALEIGWGGITKVEELTGMSHSTINKGIEELKTSEMGFMLQLLLLRVQKRYSQRIWILMLSRA